MNASSSAWVGCSCVPSPALTTEARTQPELASRCGAPLAPCRITTASQPIASRVSAVSLSDSPFDSDEPLAEKLMTSAESRLAAASNEMRVRVESSKNRFTTVRPRRAGSFLIGRSASDRISSAVAQDQLGVLAAQVGGGQQVLLHDAAPSMITASSSSTPVRWTRTRWTSEVGRFLPTKSARIGSSRWPRSTRTASWTAARPADVVQRVEGGADRAAGEQHVVDQHDDLVVDPAVGDLRREQGARRLQAQVVAVHRDVERPARDGRALDGGDALGDPLGERHAARRDAEQDEVVGALVALEDLVGDAAQCAGDVARVEDGAIGARIGRRRTMRMMRWQAQASAARPPSPPHGTAR